MSHSDSDSDSEMNISNGDRHSQIALDCAPMSCIKFIVIKSPNVSQNSCIRFITSWETLMPKRGKRLRSPSSIQCQRTGNQKRNTENSKHLCGKQSRGLSLCCNIWWFYCVLFWPILCMQKDFGNWAPEIVQSKQMQMQRQKILTR